MSPEQIVEIMRQTLWVALELAAPFLILALAVGVIISLLQTLTQLQDLTLSFVPKMLVIVFALALLFPWMMKIMTKFTHTVLLQYWEKIALVGSLYGG